MIALAGALRLAGAPVPAQDYAFGVRPRWELASLAPVRDPDPDAIVS